VRAVAHQGELLLGDVILATLTRAIPHALCCSSWESMDLCILHLNTYILSSRDRSIQP